ncbi:4-hydroxy-tetrahydrodipicolinate synthase [BD1-7 clade bacterium]|uniref:4-hydroxy-tetrahydrodipicolinate synthase n=1 Tax=BD1-7 clade bacterium TaxID=2029982 RepID=A0A5S9QI41_9GAMM|nr:4-hydroxy-tetrahydrodipicolinate synthase [BD1-7 clade bacterium]CAA0117738.1 4-hydroxy-tetrahydrodipicolinate synthase [BD1-7 clade bacterium]
MIEGSIVALVTPMTAEGQVDWSSLAELVDWHLAQGTDAIVAMGTTGESATLNVNEHLEVIKRVVDQVGKRIPVIAGTGANSTQEAIEWTQEAKKLNADACLLVTPYYNKPTQEGLYLHHKAINDAVAIPQMLYNVPGRTACDMLPETAIRISHLNNVIGIKEATGEPQRAREILARCADDFVVWSGDDGTFLDLMAEGARGNISVTANIAPETMSAVCKAALAGDMALARKLNEPLLALHDDLFLEANPIPVKWALWRMNRIANGIRLPLTWLSEEHQPAVEAALKKAGLV